MLKEKAILQELGKSYMEIAMLPLQQEKIQLWKALNRSKMQRPMVVIDQLPLHELNNEGELNCLVEDPYWREVEYSLRLALYKWKHFPVDMVIDPFITIPKVISSTGYGISAVEETLKTDSKNSVISHKYKNQFEIFEDIDKLKDMTFTHDTSASTLYLEQGNEIFNGIAPVKAVGIQFHLGLWDHLSTAMGVENIYFDLIDRPEFIHAIMERITAATIAGIMQANELAIHNDVSNTCHCSYIYTDDLLPNSGQSLGATANNCWAFGMAQLFSSVSPEITKEFEIPYISKMAEYFGAIYYGCCDRLDDRLDLVKNIPNVRKVSCSPWSKREAFAEKIGNKLIMSNKPSPAFIATDSVDWDSIKADLQHTVDLAKANNVNLEIILKDISTVKYCLLYTSPSPRD